MTEKSFAISDRLYPRKHFLGHGIFDQVAQGSVFQHLPYHAVFIVRRQCQHPEFWKTFLEFLAEIYSVDIRQAYIEEHYIRFPETDGVPAFGRTMCHTDYFRDA